MDLLAGPTAIAQDLERRNREIESLAGPAYAIQQIRSALDSFQTFERDREIRERVLGSALPAGLMASAMTRGFLPEQEIARLTKEVASPYADLQAVILARQELLGAAFESAKLAADLEALRAPRVPSLDTLRDQLSLAATEFYTDLEAASAALITPRLVQAPSLAVYTSTRSVAVVREIPAELLERHEDAAAESVLDVITDDLEARLAEVGPEFAEAYRGAMSALERGDADWCRHVSASLRELTHHLIFRFAPDAELNRHFTNPAEHMENGEFTRKARLTYIYREVATGSYVRMANNHVEITESIFYPSNAGVHSLRAPLTPKQARVFARQVQGCLTMLLEVSGY
jgi:hypothetical protein